MADNGNALKKSMGLASIKGTIGEHKIQTTYPFGISPAHNSRAYVEQVRATFLGRTQSLTKSAIADICDTQTRLIDSREVSTRPAMR